MKLEFYFGQVEVGYSVGGGIIKFFEYLSLGYSEQRGGNCQEYYGWSKNKFIKIFLNMWLFMYLFGGVFGG